MIRIHLGSGYCGCFTLKMQERWKMMKIPSSASRPPAFPYSADALVITVLQPKCPSVMRPHYPASADGHPYSILGSISGIHQCGSIIRTPYPVRTHSVGFSKLNKESGTSADAFTPVRTHWTRRWSEFSIFYMGSIFSTPKTCFNSRIGHDTLEEVI